MWILKQGKLQMPILVYGGGAANVGRGLFAMDSWQHMADDVRGGVAEAVRAAKAYDSGLQIQVEVDRIEQIEPALEAGAQRLLLDNMKPDTLREAVALVAGRVPLEASGGVNLDTIQAIAETGVDVGDDRHDVRLVTIDRLLDAGWRLSDEIARQYFVHAEPGGVDADDIHSGHGPSFPVWAHAALLVAYIAPLVLWQGSACLSAAFSHRPFQTQSAIAYSWACMALGLVQAVVLLVPMGLAQPIGAAQHMATVALVSSLGLLALTGWMARLR